MAQKYTLTLDIANVPCLGQDPRNGYQLLQIKPISRSGFPVDDAWMRSVNEENAKRLVNTISWDEKVCVPGIAWPAMSKSSAPTKTMYTFKDGALQEVEGDFKLELSGLAVGDGIDNLE